MNAHKTLNERWGVRRLELLALFAAGCLLMVYIHGGLGMSGGNAGLAASEPGLPGVPGNDSFYHIKMAALIPQYGLVAEFPWLKFCYFTDEGQAFIGHHAGFHLLLVPFVHLAHWLTGDYLAGGRWATALCFGLVLMLFDILLKGEGIRWRGVWLLLFLLLPIQFFTRHTQIRAIAPSLAFMLLIVWSMFHRHYLATAFALTGYIHLYLGGVIYGPLLIVLYIIAAVAAPRELWVIPWKLAVYGLCGWLVGVLTHPYSAGMWGFLKLQIFGSGLWPEVSVGHEWKPYEGVWWFAQSAGVILVTWVLALCTRLRLGPALNTREMFLLLANFAFLILTLKARRFIEYWPVFALLSAATLAAPFMRLVAERFDRSFSLKAQPGNQRNSRRLAVVILSCGLIGVTAYAGWPSWREIRRGSTCKYDLPAIHDAMVWLQEHSQEGDVVFTDDWDIFPVFFYYNHHNHYIVGLDPAFTHHRRPDLWARYVKVSRGQVPADAAYQRVAPDGNRVDEVIHAQLEDIRDHFGAKYVITDTDHRALAEKLAEAPAFAELVYPSTVYADSRDAPYLIFRVHVHSEPRP